MTMTAMRAEHRIRFMQMRAHPGGDGFLTHLGVTGTVNQATLM